MIHIMNKTITFFTGAGISQESGIETFRGSNGLWGKYSIDEVATIEAWNLNPSLCCEFYNERRKHINKCDPNDAHILITKFQKDNPDWDTHIITQNVDDLHERSGSENVLHLHGKINDVIVEVPWGTEVYEYEEGVTERCRPDVVMFGEDVPNMIPAIDIIEKSDYLVIVGTSLLVYPANTVMQYIKEDCKVYNINPQQSLPPVDGVEYIEENASVGVKKLLTIL